MLGSPQDVILAQATPPGRGALAVIRASGPGTIQIVDQVFRGRGRLTSAASHTAHYGRLGVPPDMVDDVVVTLFRSPTSYTGEDTAEITCHGNQLIVSQILQLLLRTGAAHHARLAEPGEFTRRAFANGRLDLAQAEAVADLIAASAKRSLRGARGQLDGYLSGMVAALREALLDCRAELEAELDFTEDELAPAGRHGMSDRLAEIGLQAQHLLQSVHRGQPAGHRVRVAILGEVNVGKSSLLNALAQDARAIVAAVPGTTRDIVQTEVTLDGVAFLLSDTAGLRVSNDPIEAEGMRRSRQAAATADLILHVVDATRAALPPALSASFPEAVPVLTVHNKSDLLPRLSMEDLGSPPPHIASGSTPRPTTAAGKTWSHPPVSVSALTGDGLPDLAAAMVAATQAGEGDSDLPMTANLRHQEALQRALDSIQRGREAYADDLGDELVAADLREAEQHLAQIVGEITADDVLERIFARFCIGK